MRRPNTLHAVGRLLAVASLAPLREIGGPMLKSGLHDTPRPDRHSEASGRAAGPVSAEARFERFERFERAA